VKYLEMASSKLVKKTKKLDVEISWSTTLFLTYENKATQDQKRTPSNNLMHLSSQLDSCTSSKGH